MKYRLFFFASLVFVLLGIGHIIADLFISFFLNPNENDLYESMSLYYLNVFGFTRSIHELMKGFSLTMGFLLIAYGTLNLLLLKKAKELMVASSIINLVNAVVSTGLVALSVLYFHWPPIVGYSFSAVLFFILFVKNIPFHR